jgi:hypothetical protein
MISHIATASSTTPGEMIHPMILAAAQRTTSRPMSLSHLSEVLGVDEDEKLRLVDMRVPLVSWGVSWGVIWG